MRTSLPRQMADEESHLVGEDVAVGQDRCSTQLGPERYREQRQACCGVLLFLHVARPARGDDVGPDVAPALRHRHDVSRASRSPPDGSARRSRAGNMRSRANSAALVRSRAGSIAQRGRAWPVLATIGCSWMRLCSPVRRFCPPRIVRQGRRASTRRLRAYRQTASCRKLASRGCGRSNQRQHACAVDVARVRTSAKHLRLRYGQRMPAEPWNEYYLARQHRAKAYDRRATGFRGRRAPPVVPMRRVRLRRAAQPNRDGRMAEAGDAPSADGRKRNRQPCAAGRDRNRGAGTARARARWKDRQRHVAAVVRLAQSFGEAQQGAADAAALTYGGLRDRRSAVLRVGEGIRHDAAGAGSRLGNRLRPRRRRHARSAGCSRRWR